MITKFVPSSLSLWLIIQSLLSLISVGEASSSSSSMIKSLSSIQFQKQNLFKSKTNNINNHNALLLLKPAFVIRGGGNGGGDYEYSGYNADSRGGHDDYDQRGRRNNYDHGSGAGGADGYYYDDDRSYYGNENERRYDDYEDDRYGNSQRQSGYESDYYGDSRDDYKERNAPSKKYSRSSPLSNLPNVGGILRNGNKKIGLSLLGAGVVFTMLGISLFFNKTLMRLGNLFFIAGVPMTIGPGRTTGYFLQPKKSRATGCLALGILLVFIGWPIFGIALEIFGVLNLFGNMFPVLMVILKQTPFVGTLLNGNSGGGRSGRSSKNDRRANSRDRYSYDDGEEEYEQGDRDY